MESFPKQKFFFREWIGLDLFGGNGGFPEAAAPDDRPGLVFGEFMGSVVFWTRIMTCPLFPVLSEVCIHKMHTFFVFCPLWRGRQDDFIKMMMDSKNTHVCEFGRVTRRPVDSFFGSRRGGFSLLELLAVISIMLILLGAAAVLLPSPISKAVEPAARISRSIALARAQAVAFNSNVALRFEQDGKMGNDELVMRFYKSRSALSSGEDTKEFRRAEHFSDVTISKSVRLPAGSEGSGQSKGEDNYLAPDESLVFTPDGQVLRGTGKTGFPATEDQLEPVITVGIQPTVAGMVVKAVESDVALVRIQCASGTSNVLQP